MDLHLELEPEELLYLYSQGITEGLPGLLTEVSKLGRNCVTIYDIFYMIYDKYDILLLFQALRHIVTDYFCQR